MEQIRVSYRFVVTVLMCFLCIEFNVVMCSEPSDALIKTYVSSSLPSTDDLVDHSAMLKVPRITGGDWNSLVVASKIPVMVLFTADWCGVCRTMIPILDQLDSEFTGRFKFYLVDVDKELDLAVSCHVRAMPTIYVYKGGDKIGSLIGNSSAERMRELVQKFL